MIKQTTQRLYFITVNQAWVEVVQLLYKRNNTYEVVLLYWTSSPCDNLQLQPHHTHDNSRYNSTIADGAQ